VPEHRPRLDVPGTITATTGLFALVYGFSHAETTSWGNPLTVAMLASSAILLTSFILIQQRSKNPLLPLRIVLDRGRGGAYLAMGLAGAGMFGVFLFLTFYLQNTLGFSPIQSGLAFLPMSAAIITTATTATTRLVPKIGPKPLVITGMAFAATAMLFFAQLDVNSTYFAHIFPGLVLLGVGLGLIFSPAFSGATVGVAHSDAGVASAMVNTSQQVGGSVGTALLSTLAGSAVTSYAADHGSTQAAITAAAVHGYTTAFYWSAAIFVIGALVSSVVFRGGVPQVATSPAAEPVLAH
jgi:predicted MFS family arabinose efflux permease